MRTEPDSDPRPSAVFEDAEFREEKVSAESHAFEPEFNGEERVANHCLPQNSREEGVANHVCGAPMLSRQHSGNRRENVLLGLRVRGT